MKNYPIIFIVLACATSLYGSYTQEKTSALHLEAITHQNPNITPETCPILYAMIKNLTDKANTSMPRYITLYEAETAIIINDVVHKAYNGIEAWVDLLGDLYICREMVANLSYEDVEAIIALAIAQKASNKHAKLAVLGASTFLGTLAGVYFLNKYYDLELGSCLTHNHYRVSQIDNYHYEIHASRPENKMKAFLYLSTVPALLITSIVSNYMQKNTDLHAAQLTNPEQVIHALQDLSNFQETYIKEDFFSRIASKLKLKAICNTLFYFIRGYNLEERLAYIEQFELQ